MSIPLGDLVEQEIGNRYNQGAGNQTIAQQLQLVSCNGKGKSAWPIDPMSPVNCLYATTTNDCQMQLQRTLQLQLQHKRVSIEAESVDGKCLAFVCLARELYTYIYICISMHILYISTDRLILKSVRRQGTNVIRGAAVIELQPPPRALATQSGWKP